MTPTDPVVLLGQGDFVKAWPSGHVPLQDRRSGDPAIRDALETLLAANERLACEIAHVAQIVTQLQLLADMQLEAVRTLRAATPPL